MSEFWKNRRVFLTGHTGFKGAWLTLWLTSQGAKVTGYALEPEANSLFAMAGMAKDLVHHVADIRDVAKLASCMAEADPEFVFHLAAQSLVRRSYRDPVETWAINVLGTINVLEAMRTLKRPCVGVMVTTDKVYENREWQHAYREVDALGGYDPYSSSKAAAEIAIASWRNSFMPAGGPLRVASARAGNVIGGGDWAEDRIVPDCMRALQDGRPVRVRNPHARRPWQHVLEPLGGYLRLAEKLSGSDNVQTLTGAFNFGPAAASNRTVGELVSEIFKSWPGRAENGKEIGAPHEAGELNLAIEKAFHCLDWVPRWDFARTVRETVNWYRACPPGTAPALVRGSTLEQISTYCKDHTQ